LVFIDLDDYSVIFDHSAIDDYSFGTLTFIVRYSLTIHGIRYPRWPFIRWHFDYDDTFGDYVAVGEKWPMREMTIQYWNTEKQYYYYPWEESPINDCNPVLREIHWPERQCSIIVWKPVMFSIVCETIQWRESNEEIFNVKIMYEKIAMKWRNDIYTMMKMKAMKVILVMKMKWYWNINVSNNDW